MSDVGSECGWGLLVRRQLLESGRLRWKGDRLRLLLNKVRLSSVKLLIPELWILVDVEAVLVLLHVSQNLILLKLRELSPLNWGLKMKTKIESQSLKSLLDEKLNRNEDI